ncbi:molybdopterin cofactor-binding domain-containing protein [Thauera butanivorans]|uniref:molybdopterin cofactor-binding domain-containing protein n=1 Tax=Thauera butanivorans TaxID=86174 RepID=UPI003AB1A782
MTATVRLSRRAFLQGSLGVLTLAVTSSGLVRAADADVPKYGADSMPGGTVDDPLVFVSIAEDGTVAIVAHRAEMGTGVRTSLPMVVADEMEALWERVEVVQAEADEARYGNQNVDGSRSVRYFLMPMRRVGAAARQMLEAAAAARWSVPVSEVRAVQHEVLHEPGGRRLGFGELAADAARQPVPAADALKLKAREDFRYIGNDKVRLVDLEAIGKGEAVYGMDMRLPGMVHAVVARPPVVGGKLRRFDGSKALTIPGVLKLVEIPAFQGAPAFQPLGGIAVVARNTWAAIQGRDALDIEWDDGPNGSYDSVAYREELEAAARAPGKLMRDQGNVAEAWAEAPEAERLAAEYYIPHLAHASMEPPVATVRIEDGRAEVWTSVQNPAAAQAAVAQAMPEGTPVKLVWTREDDIQHDYLHTVSVERQEAVIDGSGQVQSWLHRSASPTIASLFVEGAKGQQITESAMSAINMPYVIPNVRVETAEVAAHARIGWFRSVANIPHAFAAQCFIAELAHRAGKDHRQFALDLIGPARRIDPGMMADTWNYTESPERIRAQMEGGAIMGLSLALASEISFEKGRVRQSNFHDYEVLRHQASPRVIRTHLVNDDHDLPPGGVGEPPVPPVAPALCNAIFAATGKRVRSLPVRTVA